MSGNESLSPIHWTSRISPAGFSTDPSPTSLTSKCRLKPPHLWHHRYEPQRITWRISWRKRSSCREAPKRDLLRTRSSNTGTRQLGCASCPSRKRHSNKSGAKRRRFCVAGPDPHRGTICLPRSHGRLTQGIFPRPQLYGCFPCAIQGCARRVSRGLDPHFRLA